MYVYLLVDSVFQVQGRGWNKIPTPCPRRPEQEWNRWVLRTCNHSLLLLKKILLSYSPGFAARVPTLRGYLAQRIHYLVLDILFDPIPMHYWLDRL